MELRLLRQGISTGKIDTWESPSGFSTLLAQPKILQEALDAWDDMIPSKNFLKITGPRGVVLGRGLHGIPWPSKEKIKDFLKHRGTPGFYSLNLAAANAIFATPRKTDTRPCSLFTVYLVPASQIKEFGGDSESRLWQEAEVYCKPTIKHLAAVFVLSPEKRAGYKTVSDAERRCFTLSYFDYIFPKEFPAGLVVHADTKSSAKRIKVRTPVDAVKMSYVWQPGKPTKEQLDRARKLKWYRVG